MVDSPPKTEFVSDSEKLKLILILCSICSKQDKILLTRYVYVVSRNIETEDFNKILRKAMKILEKVVFNGTSCQDWLINELFTIYKLGE